jgi:hypothetical protein
MTDLQSILPPGSGWTLTTANALNDTGQIVGQGQVAGHVHAYLLTLPEPNGAAIFALTATCFPRRRGGIRSGFPCRPCRRRAV